MEKDGELILFLGYGIPVAFGGSLNRKLDKAYAVGILGTEKFSYQLMETEDINDLVNVLRQYNIPRLSPSTFYKGDWPQLLLIGSTLETKDGLSNLSMINRIDQTDNERILDPIEEGNLGFRSLRPYNILDESHTYELKLGNLEGEKSFKKVILSSSPMNRVTLAFLFGTSTFTNMKRTFAGLDPELLLQMSEYGLSTLSFEEHELIKRAINLDTFCCRKLVTRLNRLVSFMTQNGPEYMDIITLSGPFSHNFSVFDPSENISDFPNVLSKRQYKQNLKKYHGSLDRQRVDMEGMSDSVFGVRHLQTESESRGCLENIINLIRKAGKWNRYLEMGFNSYIRITLQRSIEYDLYWHYKDRGENN